MFRSSSDYGSSQQSQPASIISLENYGDSRTLKFVGVKDDDFRKTEEHERKSFIHLIRSLNLTNLVVSALLFICVAVWAACLCKPVSILGGLLVSLLFLTQGILGHEVVKLSTRSMLLGYACLSGFTSLTALTSSMYLFSGQYVLECISSSHIEDYDSVNRLYIVQVTTLVSTVPLLVGTVSSLITTVLCASQTKKPKKVHEPQLFLYLQDSYNDRSSAVERPQGSSESTEGRKLKSSIEHTAGSPPPTYRQCHEESSA